MVLSVGTDRLRQTADPDHHDLLCLPAEGTVRSGSTLFAIPPASFRLVTLYMVKPHCSKLMIISESFWVSKCFQILTVIYFRVSENGHYYTLRHSLTEIQPCRMCRAFRYVKLLPVKCLCPDRATHFTPSICHFIL